MRPAAEQCIAVLGPDGFVVAIAMPLRQDGGVQARTGRWGSTTALGLAPAMILFLAVDRLAHQFVGVWMWTVRFPGTTVIANAYANAYLVGFAVVVYLVWALAAVRGWVTCATGGGFAVIGAALVLRIVAEFPQAVAQTHLALLGDSALRERQGIGARSRIPARGHLRQ